MILTCADTLTGMGMAVQLPPKHVTEYVAAEIKAFLMDAGRASACILQSDQEPAIMALLRKVSSDMVNVKLRQSPAYSSESQGVIERYHQPLQGQIRTLCAQLEERVNLDIDSSSALLPWIVKHSAWTLSRFLVHSSDKLTSYARRRGQPYGSPTCSFGESVYFKLSVSRHAKLKSSWSHGFWLGKGSATNDHFGWGRWRGHQSQNG